MISVKKEGVILRQAEVDFESEAVLNPAVIEVDQEILMFYRAIRKGNYSTIGFCKLATPLTVASRWDKPFMVPEHCQDRRFVLPKLCSL
jgi:predicted GH43/DUF377 family glycosyl hydrolase